MDQLVCLVGQLFAAERVRRVGNGVGKQVGMYGVGQFSTNGKEAEGKEGSNLLHDF